MPITNSPFGALFEAFNTRNWKNCKEEEASPNLMTTAEEAVEYPNLNDDSDVQYG